MRKFARRLVGPVVAVIAVGSLVTGASADDHPGRPEAGIPRLDCAIDDYYEAQPCVPGDDAVVNFGSWYNTAQVGLTGSKVAKQWTQIPLTMLAANVLFYYNTFPGPDQVEPGEKANTEFGYLIRAFLVSPKGSKDDYGDSAPIRVRTVAFGSIPVEVTLQVSQERDVGGLPKPFVLKPTDYTVAPPRDRPDLWATAVVDSTRLEANLNVRVRRVVADGVDLNLGSTCQTGPAAKLSVSSKAYAAETPMNPEIPNNALPAPDGSSSWVEYLFDPEKFQYAIYGGTLNGTIDIPRFSGCSTKTGDDISPLLTSALSEKGNPASVRVGAIGCYTYDENFNAVPTRPGVNSPDDPASGCGPAGLPNTKIVTVPKQFEIPDYAPGDGPSE